MQLAATVLLRTSCCADATAGADAYALVQAPHPSLPFPPPQDPDIPLNMLKPNLHWLQHSAEWETQCGALATMLEFWVER